MSGEALVFRYCFAVCWTPVCGVDIFYRQPRSCITLALIYGSVPYFAVANQL